MDAITDVPLPTNEPVHDYASGSSERARLTAALKTLAADPIDLPHVIGGDHRMGDGDRIDVVQPHRHSALENRAQSPDRRITGNLCETRVALGSNCQNG